MSGTSARSRRTNEPVTARPRACWASRIAPARACIRGTSLDGRQDDEREPMADAAGDERLEQVVGEGREQEQDRGQERRRAPGRPR